MQRWMKMAWMCALTIALTGCDDEATNSAEGAVPDATPDIEESPEDAETEPEICTSPLGGECLEDRHCEQGICLISEFAPFGVCTVACQNPGDFCLTTEGEAIERFWCIQPPPEEFRKLTHPEVEAFCMPICDSLEECQPLEPRYEECAQPEYKGNPLYPGSPMPVCLTNGAMGKSPVDPYTCANWKATNPGEPESAALRKLLCVPLFMSGLRQR